MRLHKFATALAFTVAAVAVHAAPLPVFGAFTFLTTGGFEDGTATCTNAPLPCAMTYTNPDVIIPGPVQTYRNIDWGNPATSFGQSGLEVTHLNGNNPLVTNGGWKNIDQFDHKNNVIFTSGGALNQVQLFGEFSLTGFGINVPGTNTVMFNETVNTLLPASCSGLNPLGSACDDYFDTNALNGTAFLFSDGSFNYYLSFQFVAGANAFVEDTDPNDGMVRIYTKEGEVSTVYTQARIDAVPVPEPGMLALFGLALAAMGVVRSRKLNA